MKLQSGKTCIIETNLYDKKIIILDLDHTLIHAKRINIDTVLGDFNICNNTHTVYKRPHVDDFITWCFNNFDGVIVWSAGSRDYVEDIVRKLFKYAKPNIILARENCSTHKYYKDVLTLKNIRFKDWNINLNNSKIFFVDDIPQRIKNLNQKCIIPIKPYCTRRHIYRNRSFSGDRDNYLLRIKKLSYNENM